MVLVDHCFCIVRANNTVKLRVIRYQILLHFQLFNTPANKFHHSCRLITEIRHRNADCVFLDLNLHLKPFMIQFKPGEGVLWLKLLKFSTK